MPRKVLLVHPEKRVEHELSRLLADTGIQVFSTADAREAWLILNKIRPQLALVDASLPGESGYELSRMLKDDPRYAGTPVVLLTTRGQIYDFERADAAGVATNLEMPFTNRRDALNTILALIRELPTESLERLTPASQLILELMTYRVRASILGYLLRFLFNSRSISLPEKLFADETHLMSFIEQHLREIWLRVPNLASTVATPLPREFMALFWTQITEQLIRTQKCTLSDFGVFAFRDDFTVRFDPAPVMSSGILPQVEFASRPCDLAAVNISRLEFDPLIARITGLSGNDRLELNIFADSIRRIIPNFLQRPDVISLARTAPNQPPAAEPWGSLFDLSLPDAIDIEKAGPNQPSAAEFSESLFDLHSRAIAYMAYCFCVYSFGQGLSRSKRRAVPSIGIFELDRQGVHFHPTTEFVRLLSANVKLAVYG